MYIAYLSAAVAKYPHQPAAMYKSSGYDIFACSY